MRLNNKQSPSYLFIALTPAGAGKTTLISSYIESKNYQAYVARWDKGDADKATFFHF